MFFNVHFHGRVVVCLPDQQKTTQAQQHSQGANAGSGPNAPLTLNSKSVHLEIKCVTLECTIVIVT